MKRSIAMGLVAAGVVVVAGAGAWVGRVLATGAPSVSPLTYAGTVTDKDGKPYAAEVDVKIAFYDAAVDGNLKCAPEAVKAAAGTGWFEVVLAGECVAAFRATADLWSQTTVGSGASQQVMARSHVGAVPYALEADSAKVAGSALSAGGELKTAIDGLQAAVGTGGPWVVDAKGVTLGRFLSLYNPTIVSFQSGLYVVFGTTKGYLFKNGMTAGYGAKVFYEKFNCEGAAYLEGSGTVSYPSNILFWSVAAGALIPTGPKDGVTAGTKVKTASFEVNGICTSQVIDGFFVPVKAVPPAEVGLPPTITWPLHIEQ
ncbi:MAG: hypothetical protein ACOYOB_20340 [Myxococcota bacterium]